MDTNCNCYAQELEWNDPWVGEAEANGLESEFGRSRRRARRAAPSRYRKGVPSKYPPIRFRPARFPLPVASATFLHDRTTDEPPRKPERPAPEPASGGEPSQGPVMPEGSEQVRWAQNSLNNVLGLRLAVDGVMSAETRSAIRSFQRRSGLPEDGLLGPETERRLQAAASQMQGANVSEPPLDEPGLAPEFSFETNSISSFSDLFSQLADRARTATRRLCQRKQRLEVDGVPIWSLLGQSAFFFTTGMAIDADGAPNAYHKDSRKALDYLANAGKPGDWYGIVVDKSGNPVVQGSNDPAPGFYVSSTSLQDKSKALSSPLRYVDSSKIPYIALPGKKYLALGARLGDFAAVINLKDNRLAYAIFADVGPQKRIGEGSIALAQAIGGKPLVATKYGSKAKGGIAGGILYIVFPKSGNGQPRSLAEINREGARLFEAWGGLGQVLACKLAASAPKTEMEAWP